MRTFPVSLDDGLLVLKCCYTHDARINCPFPSTTGLVDSLAIGLGGDRNHVFTTAVLPYMASRSFASAWSYRCSGSYTTTWLPLVEKANGMQSRLFSRSRSALRRSGCTKNTM